MKKTKDCLKPLDKNHKGNYKISVSFDVFSDNEESIVSSYMDLLERSFKDLFTNYKENLKLGHKINLKNVRWNDE